jgi:hypothetical protein
MEEELQARLRELAREVRRLREEFDEAEEPRSDDERPASRGHSQVPPRKPPER